MKTAFIARVFAAGFVFNLALSLFLFEVMGREGVPVATVVTMYLVNIVNLIYCSRLLGVSVARIFPSAAVLKRLVVAFLPGVGLWLAYRLVVVDHILELAAFGAAYMLVYFGLCAWTGFITRDDIKSLIGRGPTV